MTRPMQMDIDKQWHIKKEIPLSTVGMFFVQLVSVVWLVATLNNRVDQVEKRVDVYAPQSEKIIKLGADMENLKDGIAEIKGILRNTVPTNKRTESISR